MIMLALCVLYFLISGVVEGYLVKQAAYTYTQVAREHAAQIADRMSSYDSAWLFSYAGGAGRDLKGRFLVVDSNSVVQVDGFSRLNGYKLLNNEITEVLQGRSESAYGLHKLDMGSAAQAAPQILQRIFSATEMNEEWVMYCTAPVVSNSAMIGAVMLSVSVQDLIYRIATIRSQMVLVSVVTGIGVVALSIIVSGAMIKPIRKLNEGIRLIGQGDFSQRVEVSGKSEIAELSNTFNIMSERLENLDRMRNEFVSNASHELKTPMSSIKILVETLQHQDPPDPEITKEFLGDINSEIDRMSNLVSDLLALVRMDEKSKAASHIAVTNLTRILLKVCSALDPVAFMKEITIEQNIEADVITSADPGKIEQMFYNLVENAIKYSPDNETVTVNLARMQDKIIFSVQDNGIGIEKEHLPYIFDRFYRVDKARSRTTGGTGLGLSIVKSVVMMHGGEITVNSQPGIGTTMTVTLPGTARVKNEN